MRSVVWVAVAFLAIFFVASVRADEADARKYLDQAKAASADKNNAAAETNLKLAEAELDGVEATKKAAMVSEIAALRKTMGTANASADKEKVLAIIASISTDIQRGLEGKFPQTDALKEFQEYLAKDEVKAVITPEELAKYNKQIATFSKVNNMQVGEQTVVLLKSNIDALEKNLPDILKQLQDPSSNDRSVPALQYERAAQQITGLADKLPVDSKAGAEQLLRFKAMADQFNAVYGKGMAADVYARRSNYWNDEKKDFEGSDKETTPPTLAGMTHESSEAMSRLNAPKTVTLIGKANSWLENTDKDPSVKPALSDPKVKGLVDEVRGQRDAAVAKVAKFADSVLSEAEKTPLTKDTRDRMARFVSDDLRLSLPGYSKLGELQARGQKLVDGFDKQAGGMASDREKLYDDLVKSAAAAWPAMAGKITASDGFDPTAAASKKGQTVRLKAVANRMGWDYTSPDFQFATTINGNPVAGRFDPTVKAAVDDIKKRTGKELPEETNYDIIAVVEGMGKIQRREQHESKGTIEGLNVTAKGETYVPIDVPLLRIVGLHVGPVAVASGVGAADAGGAVTPVAVAAGGAVGAAAASGGGSAWGWRILTLLIGLTAAAVALVKANFAPLTNVGQVTTFRNNLGGENLALIGLGCAALGVVWLIRGLIIYGLLVSVSIIAAGLYAALDFLVARKLIKPDLAARVRPLGVPIGLGCAVIVVLNLLVGGRLIIL